MFRNISRAALLVAMFGHAGSALAGANDFAFEALAGEVKVAAEANVTVRLVRRAGGEPVADAVIFLTRIDMAPDGMATMAAPLVPLPSPRPGHYAFTTSLPMAGRWLLSVAAKVQGERETVVGHIAIKATE
ncbi:MAG: FixH family protein [Proteobacteria bacterium]|nr:FixH family protein [Pseudomonadota bacterium]